MEIFLVKVIKKKWIKAWIALKINDLVDPVVLFFHCYTTKSAQADRKQYT